MRGLLHELWDILTPRQRRRLLLVVGGMVVGSLLEAAALAAVVPFIGALAQSGSLTDGPLAAVLERFPQLAGPRGTAMMALGLFGLFLLKNVYLTVWTNYQFRFLYTWQTELSSRLLTAYLRAPWIAHVNRQSAVLVRDINAEVPTIIGNVVFPLLTLTTEALVTAAVVALLMIVDPIVSLLCLGSLGGATWMFQHIIRAKTRHFGHVQQEARAEMIKWVMQGLGAAKETKVLRRESYFIDMFERQSGRFARTTSYHATITSLPRYFFETVVIGGVLLVVAAIAWQQRNPGEALATLALFALAVFRLMPAMTRVVSCISNVRYNRGALTAVHRGLAAVSAADGTPADDASPGATVEHTLELRDIHYRYPGAAVDALAGISLTMHKRDAIGIIGPSGAGKTTLVDVMLGLLTPTSGEIRVDGAVVDLRRWQSRVGYVPQQVFLLDDTIRRNVAFGVADEDIDEARVWEALRAAQLDGLVRQVAGGLDASAGERGARLSGGERQRLGIARALYHDPELLVLDEITASLDADTEREVTRAIQALKGVKTLIIITHRPATIAHCDVVFELRAGRLVGMNAALERA